MHRIFFVLNSIATIKHRCVTHLHGSNAIERFLLNAQRLMLAPQFQIPNSIIQTNQLINPSTFSATKTGRHNEVQRVNRLVETNSLFLIPFSPLTNLSTYQTFNPITNSKLPIPYSPFPNHA